MGLGVGVASLNEKSYHLKIVFNSLRNLNQQIEKLYRANVDDNKNYQLILKQKYLLNNKQTRM